MKSLEERVMIARRPESRKALEMIALKHSQHHHRSRYGEIPKLAVEVLELVGRRTSCSKFAYHLLCFLRDLAGASLLQDDEIAAAILQLEKKN